MERDLVQDPSSRNPEDNALLVIEAGFQKESAEEEARRTGSDVKAVKYNRFAILTANGSRPEDSARIMGVSVPTAYRWLKVKDVAETIQQMKAQVKGAGQRKLQRYQHEAIETVYEVMRTAKMDKDRLQAAFGILDRTGLSVQELLQDGQTQAAPVVIQQFMQFNANASQEQAERARRQMDVLEVPYEVRESEPHIEDAATSSAMPSAGTLVFADPFDEDE